MNGNMFCTGPSTDDDNHDGLESANDPRPVPRRGVRLNVDLSSFPPGEAPIFNYKELLRKAQGKSADQAQANGVPGDGPVQVSSRHRFRLVRRKRRRPVQVDGQPCKKVVEGGHKDTEELSQKSKEDERKDNEKTLSSSISTERDVQDKAVVSHVAASMSNHTKVNEVDRKPHSKPESNVKPHNSTNQATEDSLGKLPLRTVASDRRPPQPTLSRSTSSTTSRSFAQEDVPSLSKEALKAQMRYLSTKDSRADTSSCTTYSQSSKEVTQNNNGNYAVVERTDLRTPEPKTSSGSVKHLTMSTPHNRSPVDLPKVDEPESKLSKPSTVGQLIKTKKTHKEATGPSVPVELKKNKTSDVPVPMDNPNQQHSLPDNLPEDILEIVRELERRSHSLTNPKKFFTVEINSLLYRLETLCKQKLKSSARGKVFTYLSDHLPCSKRALCIRIKRMFSKSPLLDDGSRSSAVTEELVVPSEGDTPKPNTTVETTPCVQNVAVESIGCNAEQKSSSDEEQKWREETTAATSLLSMLNTEDHGSQLDAVLHDIDILNQMYSEVSTSDRLEPDGIVKGPQK